MFATEISLSWCNQILRFAMPAYLRQIHAKDFVVLLNGTEYVNACEKKRALSVSDNQLTWEAGLSCGTDIVVHSTIKIDMFIVVIDSGLHPSTNALIVHDRRFIQHTPAINDQWLVGPRCN